MGAFALVLAFASPGAFAASLADAVERAMAGRQGAAVAVDVASGRVLAAHRLEVAARSLVRPGSTLKPFVLAALLERGRLKPGESSLCRREVRLAGRNLDCTHGEPGVPLTGAQALAYSCNHFFAHAALRLAPEELAAALRRAIPAGPTGWAKDEAGSVIDVARTPEERQLQALGEACVRVTPLAMLAAYRRLALARGPSDVLAGLDGAARFGTARLARPDGVTVVGKTGTATGVEAHRRYAWFVGWSPAEAPKVAVLVFLEQGRGGADAAPVAGRIFAATRSARADEVTVRRYWLQRKDSEPIAMSMDDYVAAVLAGEASGFRSMEALKAMAVLVRNYAHRNRGRHAKEGFDFCDTTHCQDYRGVAVGPRFQEAARLTSGQMLWYNGGPAQVFYHADCGGGTESAERVWPGLRIPFLHARPDPYCTRQGAREWESELRKDQLVRALRAGGLKTPDPLLALTVQQRSPSGRAERLHLAGAAPAQMAASSFVFAVGRALGWGLVRSTWFEVRDLGDRLQFHGRGRGHGVGLCQMGALRMGEEGAAYAEILAYFFPGTELRNGKAGVEAQGGKAATGARGGKSGVEAHVGKAATEARGGKTATETHGAKSVVEARGGKTATEAHGANTATGAHSGKTATEAHGGKTATEARGGKTATESNGAKSVVEAHGAKSVVEARGGKAPTESNGAKTTTEAHGGNTATEARSGKVAADPRGGHAVDWKGAGGERVEVLSPNPAADARLAALGDALVREIEARVGQPLGVRPQVRVYPSTAAFRDETGEPGWVAASTRGRVIRMQPARLIEPRLRETLKHELLHVWVDRKARPGTPVWFREGVALFLARPGTALAAGRIDDAALARAPDRATLDRAYEEARSRVRRMVDRHGEATVLGWLATGLPAGE